MTPLEIRIKSLELAARIGSPFAYVSTFIETADKIEKYIMEKKE